MLPALSLLLLLVVLMAGLIDVQPLAAVQPLASRLLQVLLAEGSPDSQTVQES
jgi:hypothetical protein